MYSQKTIHGIGSSTKTLQNCQHLNRTWGSLYTRPLFKITGNVLIMAYPVFDLYARKWHADGYVERVMVQSELTVVAINET